MSSGLPTKRIVKLSLQVLLPFTDLPKKAQTKIHQLDHLMIMAERKQKQRMSCEVGNKKGRELIIIRPTAFLGEQRKRL